MLRKRTRRSYHHEDRSTWLDRSSIAGKMCGMASIHVIPLNVANCLPILYYYRHQAHGLA